MHRFFINTGFAPNRCPTALEWLSVVETSGCKNVQITADLIDPRLPDRILDAEIESILDISRAKGINVLSAFTGAFTRVNLFGHPNHQVREYWFNWYKRFIEKAAFLGVKSLGGHLSILSLAEDSDIVVRRKRLDTILRYWGELAVYAESLGLQSLIWEPMSISRELGETVSQVEEIHDRLKNGLGGELFSICLDVDHGDLESTDPADTDPYAYIARLGSQISCIHLKQSTANKGGHWPFVDEYNINGKIEKSEFLRALETSIDGGVDLVLELSFRERNPADKQVERLIRESVSYWADERVKFAS